MATYADEQTIDSALELCEEIQELADDLPDRASEFALSISEKAASIAEWIEEHGRVTDAQVEALENMKSGAQRWENQRTH